MALHHIQNGPEKQESLFPLPPICSEVVIQQSLGDTRMTWKVEKNQGLAGMSEGQVGIGNAIRQATITDGKVEEK